MSKKQPSNSENEPELLSREDILSYEEPPRTVHLPSGIAITIKYLAYLLVLEMLEAIESEENKEDLFAARVVRLLLRENEQQELYSFQKQDQLRLIEIASEEWGCKEEFDKLPVSLTAEERLYLAVVTKHEKFSREVNERMSHLSSSIAKSIMPTIPWFDEYQTNINKLTAQLTSPITNQVSETIRHINQNRVDQFSQIGEFALQISGMVDSLNALGSAITTPFEDTLMVSMRETFSNYHDLMDNQVSMAVIGTSPIVETYYPSLEMRNLSIAANLALAGDDSDIFDEIIYPDEDELISWLAELDSTFSDMLHGAEQAISSQNPDRSRHFASSHRELCTHILHTLAPTDEISEWTDDPNHFHEGRPKRKTRLQYIARNNQNGPFVKFFVSSFMSQMELLNTDEHRKQQDYGERELRILHESFLSTLGMLKTITDAR